MRHLLSVFTLAFCSLATASESVVLELPFKVVQFQFAGYYVAQEKGFYRDAGVDIDLIPTEPSVDITKVVMAGSAQFGVSNAIVLLARLNGAPLIVLADIMQHSPLVIFTMKRPDIQKISDLSGRDIEIPNLDRSLEIDAMLSHAGIGRKSYHQVSDRWGFDDLIQGKVDAISGYITAQSYQLDSRKVNYQVFNPRDHGIDYYSDALFTTEEYAHSHPAVVEAVRRATLKGWRYAMAHPDEAIDILLKQPEQARKGLTRPMLEYEAKSMEEFILPNLIPIGEVNIDRWKIIADTFVRDGLAKNADAFDGFIYDPNALSRTRLMTRISLIVGGILLVTFIIILLNLQLRRLVKKRTADLEEASRQLLHSQKIQAIGTLANGIGHDINNILSIILLNTNVLLQKTKDADSVATINVIREALERGSRISKQILQFSDNRTPEFEVVYLPALIEQLRRFLVPSLPSTIQISVKSTRDDVSVRGDSTQLYQAFFNLVVNARDALNNRGTIEIEIVTTEANVEVRVHDNGVGMEAEFVQRVFEPFFTSKPLGSGTGLGLSIVHGIIDSHGGYIKIDTEKGRGTTVRVFLPQPKASGAILENDVDPEILLAEDEAGIRSLAVMALREEGFRVCEAADGEEAWQLFQRYQKTVRLVVSDVGLPKISGSEILQRVAKSHPGINLIAISGFVEPGQLQLPNSCQLLQKPFSIEKLIEIATRVVRSTSGKSR